MNKELLDVIKLDNEITDFIDNNLDLNDHELEVLWAKEKYENRAIKLLKKLNNDDLLRVLSNTNIIPTIIPLKSLLKKYHIDKMYLKVHSKEYINEYYKIVKVYDDINRLAQNNDEYIEYTEILGLDKIEEYILKHMPNRDLTHLANETTDWTLKLYFYSFFKKKEVV